MNIYKIGSENVLTVAKFMSDIKPEFWDIDGATRQLSNGIGWYAGLSENKPKGFLLCKAYIGYRTGEIECLGYEKDEIFIVGKELKPLIEKSEEWARGQGFVNMRFIMGSRGLSCHGRNLNEPWEELKNLHEIDREEYNWFISMSYIPSGILPNIYAEKYHGVLLVKKL